MGMFDSQPRTPKVRQHFDDDNFANAMIALVVISIVIAVSFCAFMIFKPDHLTPAQAKEKTEQKKLEIEHKEELLKMCESIKDDKQMVDCMGKVEDDYWG